MCNFTRVTSSVTWTYISLSLSLSLSIYIYIYIYIDCWAMWFWHYNSSKLSSKLIKVRSLKAYAGFEEPSDPLWGGPTVLLLTVYMAVQADQLDFYHFCSWCTLPLLSLLILLLYLGWCTEKVEHSSVSKILSMHDWLEVVRSICITVDKLC